MTVFQPNAKELSAADIRPVLHLRDSAALIDDIDALNARYDHDGYLYFRGLLDAASVVRARARMTQPFLDQSLVVEEKGQFRWIGGEAGISEDSGVFNGVCRELVEHAANMRVFEKMLGEPARSVPMVNYRAYRPGNKLGGVHQDGFYSPGIQGYRPLWIALVDMDDAMGGLTLAPGWGREGYYHNMAIPPRCPIPEGIIPETAWARADYKAGDIVVIHPRTPHVGLPNRSDYMRVSIDTRVQSTANPSTVVGELLRVDADSLTLSCDDGQVRRLSLDAETFIRIGVHLGTRMTRTELRDQAVPGMPLLASIEGDRALMVRRPTPG